MTVRDWTAADMADVDREVARQDVVQPRSRTWTDVVDAWLVAGDRYRETTSAALAEITCVYCGAGAETLDHIVPRSAGGRDDPWNLVPACRGCNASKSAKSLEAWIKNLQAYVANAERTKKRLRGAEAVLAYCQLKGYL